MNDLFTAFYCLPIPISVLIILIGSCLFFLLERKSQKKEFCTFIAGVLIIWIFFIYAVTLGERFPDAMQLEPELVPFHSYRAVIAGENKELLRSNFMNIALFYPAGLLTCELLPKKWMRFSRVLLIAFIFALLSVGIEFFQYRYALGHAEIDDVMHNMLGAMLGAIVCMLYPSKQ